MFIKEVGSIESEKIKAQAYSVRVGNAKDEDFNKIMKG